MRLRQAVPDDAAVLAKVAAITFTHTFEHLYTPEDLKEYLESTYTVEQHLGPLTNPRESFWLLEDDNGEVLAFGWAGCCKLPVPDLEPNAGEIKRLYTLPDHQGKKLGTRVLDAMLAWLEEKAFSPLYLGVWSENYAAQRLYERYGFKKFCEYEYIVGNQRDHEFIFKRDPIDLSTTQQ